MTIEIAVLLGVLGAMVVLFLTEWLPIDLTAFLGLGTLILVGYVRPEEAFDGFSSPAVITMMSIFVISAALDRTGVADAVGARIHLWVGSREIPMIGALMTTAGVLSAFMNNIAATAVLMPAVAAIARKGGLAPSRLFMPLAFGAILGGTTTLVGTPPNIVAGELLRQAGMESFSLFAFTPIGLALLATGILFMVTIGRRLLPDRGHGPVATGDRRLEEVYRLQDQLLSLRVPPGSWLDGVALRDARLGSTLGVQVAGLVRDGQKRLAPDAETLLHGDDVLLLQGRLEEVEKLLRAGQMDVERTTLEGLPRPGAGIGGARLRLRRRSPMVGRTLQHIRFRQRFGAMIVGIRRGEHLIRDRVGNRVLEADDRLLALGPREGLERLSEMAEDFEVRAVGLGAIRELRDEIYLLEIGEGSTLAGTTIAESRLGELVGVTVAGIARNGEVRLFVGPDEVLDVGDRLIVAGAPDRVLQLRELAGVEVTRPGDATELQSPDVGLVEVTLSPRSTLAGRTLKELSFRDRWGLQVIAVWRGGKALHSDLADLRLALGDALLLQGSRRRIRALHDDPELVLLDPADSSDPDAPADPVLGKKPKKAPFAIAGLGLMILGVVSGVQPIQVASFVAASLVILFGCLSMPEVYRAIEWKAIFLVAAVLPVGGAMERTGAAELLATTVVDVAGPWGPHAVLAALIVLSSVLSQGLDGAPAVVLLTPVALGAAEQLGISPYPILMGVAVAASAAFMTPFSHKANLLVMGAGGYRAVDYLRVGTPLTAILLVLMVLGIPLVMPFQ